MTSPTGPVLVVGYTMAMQKALDKFMPDDSCAFVDEPTVARKRDAAAAPGRGAGDHRRDRVGIPAARRGRPVRQRAPGPGPGGGAAGRGVLGAVRRPAGRAVRAARRRLRRRRGAAGQAPAPAGQRRGRDPQPALGAGHRSRRGPGPAGRMGHGGAQAGEPAGRGRHQGAVRPGRGRGRLGRLHRPGRGHLPARPRHRGADAGRGVRPRPGVQRRADVPAPASGCSATSPPRSSTRATGRSRSATPCRRTCRPS